MVEHGVLQAELGDITPGMVEFEYVGVAGAGHQPEVEIPFSGQRNYRAGDTECLLGDLCRA
jgi:hypothetical protein